MRTFHVEVIVNKAYSRNNSKSPQYKLAKEILIWNIRRFKSWSHNITNKNHTVLWWRLGGRRIRLLLWSDKSGLVLQTERRWSRFEQKRLCTFSEQGTDNAKLDKKTLSVKSLSPLKEFKKIVHKWSDKKKMGGRQTDLRSLNPTSAANVFGSGNEKMCHPHRILWLVLLILKEHSTLFWKRLILEVT